MTNTLYTLSLNTFVPMLKNLSQNLDKAGAFAREKNFDFSVLANARLAPDMFPLTRQVQLSSDHAKGAMARLMGAEQPVYEDTETTLDELKARIEKTIDYVEGAPEAAFEGAAERKVVIEIPSNGIAFDMTGETFLRDWALPNFYFHVVTAYDILRNNGVELGKRDFMGHVGKYMRQLK